MKIWKYIGNGCRAKISEIRDAELFFWNLNVQMRSFVSLVSKYPETQKPTGHGVKGYVWHHSFQWHFGIIRTGALFKNGLFLEKVHVTRIEFRTRRVLKWLWVFGLGLSTSPWATCSRHGRHYKACAGSDGQCPVRSIQSDAQFIPWVKSGLGEAWDNQESMKISPGTFKTC